MSRERRFQQVFDLLFAAFGAQEWWPAETAFEVMVGAILTQNTAWKNVERAIANLRSSDKLEPTALGEISQGKLAALIRPAGFFNVKAKRLRAYLDYFGSCYDGDSCKMRTRPMHALRSELLGVNGVGPETADSILLYALGKPSFVVDAYTRRIFSRLGLVDEQVGYGELRDRFSGALPKDVGLYQEYHALIVALGKEICRPKPKCGLCPLREICPVGRAGKVGFGRA